MPLFFRTPFSAPFHYSNLEVCKVADNKRFWKTVSQKHLGYNYCQVLNTKGGGLNSWEDQKFGKLINGGGGAGGVTKSGGWKLILQYKQNKNLLLCYSNK